MLHEFLTSNRDELIQRCRTKVAKRYEPMMMPASVDHGVPLFLQQLVETLRSEQFTSARETSPPSAPALSVVGRTAGMHGAELLRLGYSVDQVVHEYGDVCQSVTEMAVEQQTAISADEFRTLNRCLDDAIADAVTAYGQASQNLIDSQAETLHDRLHVYTYEHRRLVDIAIQSYSAIRTGSVGLNGATGTLLTHTLNEIRSLAERSLPQIHLAAANTSVTPH